jgi:hypothetical protein
LVQECTYVGDGSWCLKEDLIWAYRKFMNENMMEHLNSDYEYKWLAAICDDHNINGKLRGRSNKSVFSMGLC